MKRTLLILITAVALCFFAGCSSTKTTVKADVTEEAAITASSEQRTHGETTGVAAILTATQSNERQNVVIDFTKIEFYPGAVPPLPRTAPAAAIGLTSYSPPLILPPEIGQSPPTSNQRPKDG